MTLSCELVPLLLLVRRGRGSCSGKPESAGRSPRDEIPHSCAARRGAAGAGARLGAGRTRITSRNSTGAPVSTSWARSHGVPASLPAPSVCATAST